MKNYTTYETPIYYNFIFGITYGYNGLTMRPCVPTAFGVCEVQFSYLDKKFTVKYTPSQEKEVIFNGKKWTKTAKCEENGKTYPFLADEDMQKENIIEIGY